MDWLQVAVLAIIQGLTEFLPISSSGHLVLPSELLGWPDQGLAFDVAVHVGSLAAVMLYFRREVTQLLLGWWRSVLWRQHSEDSHLAWCVLLGTLPAGAIGLLANDWIEQHLRSVTVIASTTLVFGLLLGLAQRIGLQRRQLTELTWQVALLVGCAQVLALIPGTSRSGVTITMALLLNMNLQAAARFSFLLTIPLILAAGGLKTLQLAVAGDAVPWAQILVGTLLSGLTAYACIFAFLRLLDRIGMMPFVIYRIGLAGVLFAVALS